MSKANMLVLEGLRAYLTARISPARALNLSLEAIDPVIVAAPLEPSLNDKGTAFAGSLFSAAALAGWALLTRWCTARSLDAEVALQSSNARFLAPARADFRAIAREPPAAQWEKLGRMLARSGRGRAAVCVDVRCHEAVVMTLDGVYAVMLAGRAK
jgi:thioesterase domain-containing protein